MDSQNIISTIQNVGFPIAISIYLLVRMESKMDQLTESITELSKIIEARI
ncbi:YvrJ family protein [Peptostreptococcus porci]|nr:YvrJ family protein [Peptostreptococcus porci]MDD7182662.1 YvrJ family protein [Peptostreptococcus porci]